MSRARRQAALLRVARISNVPEAIALAQDPATPVHRRILAARIVALEVRDPSGISLWDLPPSDSPLWASAHDRTLRIEQETSSAQYAEFKRRHLETLLQKHSWKHPEAAWPVLRNALLPAEIRGAAAHVLGAAGIREAAFDLVSCLSHEDSDLFGAAHNALRDLNTKRATRPLLAILRGPFPPEVRALAADLLWDLRDPRALPALRFHSNVAHEAHPYVRDRAAEGVGIGRATLTNQRALATALRDPSPSVRHAALCACSSILYDCRLSLELRNALEERTTDSERYCEPDDIATFAAELLARF